MFGGISIWQLLIVLLLVVLLFGTKKLRNLGTDLGSAFKGFKKSMTAGEQEAAHKQVVDDASAANVKDEQARNAQQKSTSETDQASQTGVHAETQSAHTNTKHAN